LHCIILDRIGTVPQIESIRIDSNAADEKVVPVAALEIIVSRAALQHIIPFPTVQQIYTSLI